MGTLELLGPIRVGADVDFNHHFALRMNLRHFVHMTLEQGVTDIVLESIPAGTLEQDFHVYKIAASVDAAPGSDKTVTASVTNGTDTMTVSLSDAETSGTTTTGAFNVDVSAQPLTLKYSQTGGGASKKITILIMYYYIGAA